MNLNHLRRGGIYRAITSAGVTVGEYLGIEAFYGEHSVLLRGNTGTRSIPRSELVSIELAAGESAA
jgi:hypothetical protein